MKTEANFIYFIYHLIEYFNRVFTLQKYIQDKVSVINVCPEGVIREENEI